MDQIYTHEYSYRSAFWSSMAQTFWMAFPFLLWLCSVIVSFLEFTFQDIIQCIGDNGDHGTLVTCMTDKMWDTSSTTVTENRTDAI